MIVYIVWQPIHNVNGSNNLSSFTQQAHSDVVRLLHFMSIYLSPFSAYSCLLYVVQRPRGTDYGTSTTLAMHLPQPTSLMFDGQQVYSVLSIEYTESILLLRFVYYLSMISNYRL